MPPRRWNSFTDGEVCAANEVRMIKEDFVFFSRILSRSGKILVFLFLRREQALLKGEIMQNKTTSIKTKQRDAILYVVLMALFSALAYALTFFFSIKVSFLTFDVKDGLITVAAFLFGPLSGILISLLVATLELVTVSATGFYGFLMNFLSSATFSAIAGFIYSRRKTLNHALISLIIALFSMVGVMMLANLFITPFYTGMDTAGVASMIPTLLLPFNIAKGLVNASVAMLLYKPIATTIRRSGFMPKIKTRAVAQAGSESIQTQGHKDSFAFNKGTVIVVIAAVLSLIVAAVILYLLHAEFQIF